MNTRLIAVSAALGAAIVAGVTTAGTATAFDPTPPKPPIPSVTPTLPGHVRWVKCPPKLRDKGLACFRVKHQH